MPVTMHPWTRKKEFLPTMPSKSALTGLAFDLRTVLNIFFPLQGLFF